MNTTTFVGYLYHFNETFYNYCLFKLKSSVINDIRNKKFNQINVRLVTLCHHDKTTSLKTRENDGLNNVAYYSEASAILHK
ncbi:MAG: hypothetical protein MJ228_03370 [Bacilli bacterium]|nr:hypothetical protein [Bacilli bacterium]